MFTMLVLIASRPLHDELSSLLFMNEGTVRSDDTYVYEVQKVSYNEPDNVTCSMCGWGNPGSRSQIGRAHV